MRSLDNLPEHSHGFARPPILVLLVIHGSRATHYFNLSAAVRSSIASCLPGRTTWQRQELATNDAARFLPRVGDGPLGNGPPPAKGSWWERDFTPTHSDMHKGVVYQVAQRVLSLSALCYSQD
jgi:hypothetical protein